MKFPAGFGAEKNKDFFFFFLRPHLDFLKKKIEEEEREEEENASFNTLTSPLSDSPEDYSVTVMSKAGYCCAVSGTGRFVSGLYFLSEFFPFRCDDLTRGHSLFSRFLRCFFPAFASWCFVW